MKYGIVQRILGILLMGFSTTMLPPLLVSYFYGDGGSLPFYLTFLSTMLVGLLVWYPVRNDRRELLGREGFLIVAMFWIVLGGVSALPLYLSEFPRLTVTDAVFEAVSALTTTGATIIVGLDSLPQSLLWYRQQLQWFGGLGVVVIAIAILPMLGVGGMQLFRAETSGPLKEEKMTPRLRGTAKLFFLVYLALTAACGAAYWFAGMTPFDAIGHAFSTVSTGGFSTHDASIAYFDSWVIELICIVFMAAGGISFALHLLVFRSGSLRLYWKSTECRTFLLVVLATSLAATAYLVYAGAHESTTNAVRAALFQVMSVMTSTGFGTESFAGWPGFLPVMLMFISITGACAGSTTGGMKMVRVLMVFRQGVREINRIVHPHAEIPVKLDGRAIQPRVMESIWGFFALYAVAYLILMLLMLGSGLDQVSAFGAVAATLNNLGPGLGTVASNFIAVNDFGKWVGIAGMLLGRLEIFTLLVLLTPEFWRS